MNWHLVIHWLDVFRHDNAFTWAWYTWIGNVSAGIIIGSVATLVWPRVRHAIEKFFERKFGEANKEIHQKLDHIILHHPDIPPFVKKEDDEHVDH